MNVNNQSNILHGHGHKFVNKNGVLIDPVMNEYVYKGFRHEVDSGKDVHGQPYWWGVAVCADDKFKGQTVPIKFQAVGTDERQVYDQLKILIDHYREQMSKA